MTALLAGVILYVVAVCVASGLLLLPAAALAESLPPGRPAREAYVWLSSLALPHFLAGLAIWHAARLHALDPVPWALRNARVKHLCFWSLADSPDAGYRFTALGTLACLLVAVGLLRPLFAALLSWRYAVVLTRASTPVRELNVWLTPLDTPWSTCTGFLRSQVHVSRGLASLLDAEELGAVIAHEQAHADRRDNLRLLMAQALFGPAIVMPSAHYALRRLKACLEQAADQLAADREGDEAALASALVRAARKLRDYAGEPEEPGLRAWLALRHREEFVAQRARQLLGAEPGESEGPAGVSAPPRRVALVSSTLILLGLLIASGSLWPPTVRCLYESVLAALRR